MAASWPPTGHSATLAEGRSVTLSFSCWRTGEGEHLRPCGEPPAYSSIRPSYLSHFLSRVNDKEEEEGRCRFPADAPVRENIYGPVENLQRTAEYGPSYLSHFLS